MSHRPANSTAPKKPFSHPQQIVQIDENDQHHDEGKPDLEADFLYTPAQGTPAHDFDGVEQQMAAIQNGYRQQIQEADVGGN